MVDCWDTAICRAATPCHRAGSSAGASIINGGGEYVSLAEIFLRKLLRFCLSRLAIGSQNRTASGENSRCNKKAHPAFRQDARKIACGYFQANGTNLVHFAPKSSVSCNFISYLRHKISQSASSSGIKFCSLHPAPCRSVRVQNSHNTRFVKLFSFVLCPLVPSFSPQKL